MGRGITYYKNYLTLVVIKRLLQQFPHWYIRTQLNRYKGQRYQRKIVTENTDLIIEGYPRSANSFSVKAFKYVNGDDYKIATHLHAYPQVIVGVKYKIPTMVLIREPFSCVVSYAALSAKEIGVEQYNMNYNLKWLIEDYVVFYKNLLPYRDKFVVAPFTQVLDDYGAVITEVNQKFGTDFIPFQSTEAHVKNVFDSAKEHLSPSKKRENIKTHFLAEMELLRTTPKFKEAEQLYTEWTRGKFEKSV